MAAGPSDPTGGTRSWPDAGWLPQRLARWLGQRSLRRQLLLWLLLPQLVLWGAAASVTYNLAARYADRGIDASLLQATRSLARQVKPIGNGLFIDFPKAAQDILEADPEDRFFYMVSTPPGQFILGNRQLPLPEGVDTPRLGQPYFYDGRLDRLRIRLAALYVPIGDADARQVMLVQVARSQASRDELARGILVDTVLPLSGLIVLMTMIVWAGIGAGLAPLSRLRALVQDRAPNDLAPIELDRAPSEVRALARALNQLLAAVHESVAAQRRFISHAAHQLRTPLAGLKSQTELAQAANHDPDLAQRLARVHESAVRSAHVVNQLMALTRAEPEAALATPRSRFDLRAEVVALVAEAVPRALHAGIDLGLADEPVGDEPPLMIDGWPVLLREAVSNLVDNALRYAGKGSEVTVLVRQQGEQALVEVIDTGPGLPEDQLEGVFGRFVRATHEGSGCGLGLAIVREIAERHGGQASLLANRPQGLIARLTLPRLNGP
jgi:two-component system sensor histidine kinase TctE